MSKGEETRAAIVDRAIALASQLGLEALSVGTLADEVGMSKSGLFAHFKSKQDLQLQVLEAGVERFLREVAAPSFKAPRGIPRLEALLNNWLDWTRSSHLPGGCLFITLATEFDDRPGPLCDRLRHFQKMWMAGLARAARIAVEEGHFRADLDVEQFAYEFFAIFLSCHHFTRLLRDPAAEQRARQAFKRLINTSRA